MQPVVKCVDQEVNLKGLKDHPKFSPNRAQLGLKDDLSTFLVHVKDGVIESSEEMCKESGHSCPTLQGHICHKRGTKGAKR